MNKYYEKSKEYRDRGKKGENKGIPLNLPKLKKVIPNIQKGKYYLISTDSGVGKTKLTNYLFLYTPFFKYMENPSSFDIDINYYTAEMPEEELLAELQAYWLFTKKGILVDTDHIYSQGENKISDKVDKLLDSSECIEMMALFEEKVNIVNEGFGYKYIYKELIKSANKHGKIVWGKEEDGQKGFIESYTEYNPNMFNINILDNFQRLQRTNGESAKQTIDELSRRMDWARQKFNQIWVGLQQINRNTKNLDRYKLEQFFPGPESLKDSENPYHDCQICIVGISPAGLRLKTFDGYKVLHDKESKGLLDRLRPIRVIKNRGGISNKVGYLKFFGECAYFSELPEPEKITREHYNNFFEKYG